MNAITYSQLQELVNQFPAAKLPLAYNLLVDLAKKEVDVQSPQVNFMLLPLNDRRRIMMQQAKQMIAHYEQGELERQAWQAGDFITTTWCRYSAIRREDWKCFPRNHEIDSHCDSGCY